ncbi:CBS domain-containing protein [Betaproteobacteria bacterium PRO7]|nr:CBS domain-containing protein [Betaproteobacteria bacterium PRO7]
MQMERESTELLLRDTSRAVLVPADHPHATKVGLDARGISVMTDLDRTPAVTVDDGTQIDEALRLMKEAGVRSAFVIDGGSNVLGLVTAYDIVGDKPLRYLDSLGCTLRTCSRADVRVGDIMEPVERWLVIDVDDLAAYSVGDVVETFRRSGRTHIPVVERTDEGADRLRGLLSAAEVARATGVDTGGLRPAATFAEIELAVQHGALP